MGSDVRGLALGVCRQVFWGLWMDFMVDYTSFCVGWMQYVGSAGRCFEQLKGPKKWAVSLNMAHAAGLRRRPQIRRRNWGCRSFTAFGWRGWGRRRREDAKRRRAVPLRCRKLLAWLPRSVVRMGRRPRLRFAQGRRRGRLPLPRRLVRASRQRSWERRSLRRNARSRCLCRAQAGSGWI